MLHKKLNYLYQYRHKLKNKIKNYNKFKKNKKNDKFYIRENWEKDIRELISRVSKIIKKTKEDLKQQFVKTREDISVRKLNKKHLNKKNVISIFDATTTRILKLQENELSDNLIVIRVYFFEILEDIIKNGFILNNEKYIFFTASAGQIRTKKVVFIKESVWNKCKNTITCGLSIKHINELGGVNINKYLAYLSLNNSATDLWEDFDIDKAIVVDDFETNVLSRVEFIDDKTYESEKKYLDVPITHTDGCGMMLPSQSKKAKMCRLPWVKGLLIPFPFDKFIKNNNLEKQKKDETYNCGKIRDIYNKEYDIIKDGIEIIFTKSQFKMYKYYKNWDDYKKKFKEYNCQAGYCNEEEDIIKNAKINYQMIQTLPDMTNTQLEQLCSKTKKDIENIGKNRYVMQKVLGAVRGNKNKNYLQQAIEYYPELLQDDYSKDVLKQVKKSMVNDAKAAKVEVNGKYTFISPDLYAFCEYLFLGDKDPKGLLNDNEVYCNIFTENEELDCLRSPHLYFEHAIRNNLAYKKDEKETTKEQDNLEEWFITKSLYTSCHDVISKILQFDVDGDKSLVCAEKPVIEAAKSYKEKNDILPLFYNMQKADPIHVDNISMYNGMVAAYKGGNIGMISNDITKIWNSNNISLEAIKLLCMENNFTIDYAKTLYKLTRPKEKNELITKYTKHKVPYFFIYAKDKHEDKVESKNKSVVNKLGKIITNPNIKFEIDFGKFDYKKLMANQKLQFNKNDKMMMKIINKYEEMDLKKYFIIDRSEESEKESNVVYMYQEIRKNLLKINNDENFIVDVLVKYLYDIKKSKYKTTLWESFGDTLVYNIKNNIEKKSKYEIIQCSRCGKLIEKTSNKTKCCEGCIKEKQLEWQRNSMKKIRNNKM